MNHHRRIGVYAVVLQDDKLLMIQKCRGPFSGRYGLPGGGIEPGEPLIETLHREMLEETGFRVAQEKQRGTYDVFFEHNRAGVPTLYHHIAIIYDVTLGSGMLKTDGDGQDSEGALWVPMNELAEDRVGKMEWKVIQTLKKS